MLTPFSRSFLPHEARKASKNENFGACGGLKKHRPPPPQRRPLPIRPPYHIHQHPPLQPADTHLRTKIQNQGDPPNRSPRNGVSFLTPTFVSSFDNGLIEGVGGLFTERATQPLPPRQFIAWHHRPTNSGSTFLDQNWPQKWDHDFFLAFTMGKNLAPLFDTFCAKSFAQIVAHFWPPDLEKAIHCPLWISRVDNPPTPSISPLSKLAPKVRSKS